ncbi:MAG: hypothetical protein ACYDDZ_15040 [Acidimicrobiales bacterium]
MIKGRRQDVFAVVSAFAVSRLAFYLAGVRINAAALTGHADEFQLLDLQQLQHHLVHRSIWYLQSQPPLFNVASGLLLKLPASAISPTLVVGSLALSLGMALSFFYLCLEMSVPATPTYLLTVLVILAPSNVFYSNWWFYSFPTAVFVTFGALCAARFVRTRSTVWGTSFFGSMAVVVLLNSTFQWIWLAAAAVPVVLALRVEWRKVLIVSLLPLALVAFWYLKNAALFGTSTTSSWLGMNLADVTTFLATPAQISTLVHRGKVNDLIHIPPFSQLSEYGPEYRHARTGVAVLDAPTKTDGNLNLNNIAYIRISDQYLHNDLAYIEMFPSTYLHTVSRATILFFVPSGQYYFLGTNSKPLSGYVRAYDLAVDWQVHPTAITTDPFSSVTATFGQTSISAIVLFAITLIGVPVLFWRRRSRDPLRAAPLGYIWISTVYVLGLGVLVDFGENQRFRYDLGQLPLAAAAAVVAALVAKQRFSPAKTP